VPTPTFPFPAPTDDDWSLSALLGDVTAVAILTPGGVSQWAAQYTVGDSGEPALPWLDDDQNFAGLPLFVGGFGSARVWVRVRWLDGGSVPISDWSSPQFIDVA